MRKGNSKDNIMKMKWKKRGMICKSVCMNKENTD